MHLGLRGITLGVNQSWYAVDISYMAASGEDDMVTIADKSG